FKAVERTLIGPPYFSSPPRARTMEAEQGCAMAGQKPETLSFHPRVSKFICSFSSLRGSPADNQSRITSMSFNPSSYTPAIAALLENAPCNDLGPGKPNESRRAQLAALSPESLAGSHKLSEKSMALACLAGLSLRHDFLDESHRISQDIETPSGSYWHGI